MDLSEENLSQIIKDALAHYRNKEFGCAKYVPMLNGFGVQFYDGPLPASVSDEQKRRKPDDDDNDSSEGLSPISVFNLPGSGTDFGSFGGGSSGGGGASGDW